MTDLYKLITLIEVLFFGCFIIAFPLTLAVDLFMFAAGGDVQFCR